MSEESPHGVALVYNYHGMERVSFVSDSWFPPPCTRLRIAAVRLDFSGSTDRKCGRCFYTWKDKYGKYNRTPIGPRLAAADKAMKKVIRCLHGTV